MEQEEKEGSEREARMEERKKEEEEEFETRISLLDTEVSKAMSI